MLTAFKKLLLKMKQLRIFVFLPLVYTLYNKKEVNILQDKTILVASFWDLIIWKYITHEFMPILIALLAISYSGFESVLHILLGFLTATLLLLFVYEVGYMINDLLAKYEPEKIKTDRISTLGIKYECYIFLTFSKFIFSLMLVFFLVRESLVFTALIWITFLAHSIIHSSLLRGIVTAPLLKILRALFLLPLSEVNVYRIFVISYGLALSFMGSYTYLSAKGLLISDIPRLYELASTILLTTITYYAIMLTMFSEVEAQAYYGLALLLILYYLVIYSIKRLFKQFLKVLRKHA